MIKSRLDDKRAVFAAMCLGMVVEGTFSQSGGLLSGKICRPVQASRVPLHWKCTSHLVVM